MKPFARTPTLLPGVLVAAALVVACGDRTGDPVDAGRDGGEDPTDAGADASSRDAGRDASTDAGSDGGESDGGAADAGAPDGGMPLELLRERWCTTFARAACSDRFTCGCGGERPPPDVEVCVTYDVARCIDELESRLGSYFAAGTLTVDPDALDRCATRLAASFSGCSATREDVAQLCEGVLVAALPIGGGCFVSDALCAGGAGSCVSGECALLPAVGESCADYQQCAPGAACRGDVCADLATDGMRCARDGDCAGDLLCVGGTCRAARVAIGSACTETAECVAGARCIDGTCGVEPVGACESDADCPSLSACAARRGRVCQDAAATGASCTSSATCGPTQYCDTSSTFPGTCQPLHGAGDICPLGDEQCALDSICDNAIVPPTCRPVGPLGTACTPIAWGRDGCLPDLSCVGGVCSVSPDLGAPCADDGECAPGLACRIDATDFVMRCSAPAGVGETCSSFGARNECADGLFCEGSGVCTVRRVADEPCASFVYECAEGLTCLPQPDGTPRCRPLPSSGQECVDACADALVCADGLLGGACTPIVCDAIPGGGR